MMTIYQIMWDSQWHDVSKETWDKYQKEGKDPVRIVHRIPSFEEAARSLPQTDLEVENKRLQALVLHYESSEYSRKSFDQTQDIIKRADDAERQLEEVSKELEKYKAAFTHSVAVICFNKHVVGADNVMTEYNEMPKVVSCDWLPDGNYEVYLAPKDI